MTVRDDTYAVSRKCEKVYYRTERILRKLAKMNNTTPGRLNKIIFETFIEVATEWLIVDKKPFSVYKNHAVFEVLNADATLGVKYNIERRGNQPMPFISMDKSLMRKRKSILAVIFVGKARDLYLKARENFEEYISVKESKYAFRYKKHDVHDSQRDHESSADVNKE